VAHHRSGRSKRALHVFCGLLTVSFLSPILLSRRMTMLLTTGRSGKPSTRAALRFLSLRRISSPRNGNSRAGPYFSILDCAVRRLHHAPPATTPDFHGEMACPRPSRSRFHRVKKEAPYDHSPPSHRRSGAFDIRRQAPGGSSSITFSKEGVAEVRCSIHPKMKLLVTVRK
jgi:hypothetical protein